MRLLVVAAVLAVALPASAQHVLVIPDDDASGTQTLITGLTNGGLNVTSAGVPSYQYAGNPVLVNNGQNAFDVVMILAGGPGPSSANVDMPPAGQKAIADFVANRGGLILSEWAALQVAQGRWQTLAPLVLLQRSGGISGFVDYTVEPAFQNHPLWAGIVDPNGAAVATFNFATASNVGVVNPGPGVVRVATSKLAGDALAIRDAPNVGRIVELSTAGNYSPGTWGQGGNPGNLMKLVINACKWASASRVNNPPVANAGGPYMVDEGGEVTLSGSCTDPNGDPTTLAWDFNNAGLYMDATGATPTFSALNLQGPQTVTVALKCSDLGGLFGTATATVTINNVAPKFTSSPLLNALEATQYTYQATASDPDKSDTLTCALVSGPMGMTVDPMSCVVSWLPTFDQARTASAKVTITVTDHAMASDTQSYTILVRYLDADMDGLPDTWEKLYFTQLCQMMGKDPLCYGAGDDPDKDGRPNLKEYQDGTDPTHYDGPSAPTIVSPDMGVRATMAPPLIVMNAMEPHGDALTYEFAIYSDAQLKNLVGFILGVPEGMGGQTSFDTTKSPGSDGMGNPLPPVMFTEDTTYYWRSRAHDPYVAGMWSNTGSFFFNAVHHPPTAPSISMPMDGAKVKQTHPTLTINNAHSPDGLKLTYTFELYSDQILTQLVEASKNPVAEGGMGETSYNVTTDLTAFANYYWRAKATDEQNLDGPWSKTARFSVFPNNPPPTPPTITSPKDGERVKTRMPTFMFGGSQDLEGEPITYECDLDTVNTFDSMAKQSITGLPPDQQDASTWMPPMTLTEDQHYWLRCRAKVPSGSSTWTIITFVVAVNDDPPSVPTLTNPSMGGMASSPVVRFTWVNSTDPTDLPLHYDVQVFSDSGLTQMVGMATGGDGPTGVTIDSLNPGTFWWRARAVDDLNAASDYSPPNQFTVSGYTVIPTVTTGCGCHVGATPARPPLAVAVLGLLGLALVVRRRRR